MGRKFIDLTQQKFGRLVVISPTGRNKGGNYCWLCQCECGNKTIVISSSLRSGVTKSCGCLQREMSTKHGHRKGKYTSITYKSWAKMIERCTNFACKRLNDWGGRGITICEE